MARRIVYFGIRLLATPFILLFSPLFYLVARTGVGVGICRKLGFHPTLIHYYQTVPRYEDIPESYYSTRQDFPGFSINPEAVNATLASLSHYAGECVWPENKTAFPGFDARTHRATSSFWMRKVE